MISVDDLENLSLGSTSVLIVDDSRDVSHLLKTIFLEHAFDVAQAFDGEEALTMAQVKNGFDLYVIDLQMPKMDGRKTIKHLFELYLQPKIVILSADENFMSDYELVAESVGQLLKPFSLKTVNQLITKLKGLFYSKVEIPDYLSQIEGGDEIFKSFIAESTLRYKSLIQAAKVWDVDKLKFITHQVKASGAFGFNQLSKVANDFYIELLKDPNCSPKLTSLLQRLVLELQGVAKYT